MRGITAVVLTVVAGLTALEGDHGMVHGRIGKAHTLVRMTANTIDLRTLVVNRDMGQRIRVISDVGDTGRAALMATGSRTAAVDG